MASGVLPVFLGRATRLIEYAPIHTKRYEAEFIMGIRTDTEDMTEKSSKEEKSRLTRPSGKVLSVLSAATSCRCLPFIQQSR